MTSGAEAAQGPTSTPTPRGGLLTLKLSSQGDLPQIPIIVFFCSGARFSFDWRRTGLSMDQLTSSRSSESLPDYALSLRQPWAALLAYGHKTIEIRRWPTRRRGPVLIHAARIPDDRPEAWARLPARLRPAARLQGGFVGLSDLTDCFAYTDPVTFAADAHLHFNEPDWFQGPTLYGFTFVAAKPIPFQPFPGWVRFFRVDLTAKHGPQRERP